MEHYRQPIPLETRVALRRGGQFGAIELTDTFVATDTEQPYEALEAPYGCTSYQVDVNLDMRKANRTPLDTALKDRGDVACGQLRVNCSHRALQGNRQVGKVRKVNRCNAQCSLANRVPTVILLGIASGFRAVQQIRTQTKESLEVLKA